MGRRANFKKNQANKNQANLTSDSNEISESQEMYNEILSEAADPYGDSDWLFEHYGVDSLEELNAKD